MVWRISLAILTCTLALAGCAISPPRSPDPQLEFGGPGLRALAYRRSFLRAEWSILHAMARTDRRIAARMPLVGAEQGTLARFVDPYMFSDRDASLRNADEDFARCRVEPVDWDVKMHDHVLEQALFARMLNEEHMRLEHERTGVRDAAVLVRELAGRVSSTRGPTPSHDSVVAWRLDQLRDAIRPNDLSDRERVELLASVAALRGAAIDWRRTRRAAALLEAQLTTLISAPLELDDFAGLEPLLRPHVDAILSPDELSTSLERARETLDVQIAIGLRVLAPSERAEVLRIATKRVLDLGPPCLVRVEGSVMRSLAPPPERAWACDTARVLASAGRDTDELAALIVARDRATIALWALSMHGRDRSVEAAQRWALVSSPPLADVLAVVARDPIALWVAGATLIVLTKGSAGQLRSRAIEWFRFGNAPIDLASAEVFAEPRPFGRHAPVAAGD